MDLRYWLGRAVEANQEWVAGFPPYETHPSVAVGDAAMSAAFEELAARLRGNYPYFHPQYAGQMLKPPHPVAVAGYVTAMLVNPNNHGLEGGPATTRMEREVVAKLAGMFGLGTHLGHLTSSGTIANLEALFVARESHPGLGVAYSADAHFTHERMCRVLGVRGHAVATDDTGAMDLDALEKLLRTGEIGTVVLTAGTTGLGAVDPIAAAVELKERFGVRLHVDAAYGGFYALVAEDPALRLDPVQWQAISRCDSVTVDPHKHGLQPYGCGAILFSDPEVARHYLHDSPYTYFTSDELQLGQISLECSRAGAAAAALWLTLEVFPLRADGLGAVLAATRRAALRAAELIDCAPELTLYQQPQLDTVAYFPAADGTISGIDAASGAILDAGMTDDRDPIFLSTLRVDAEGFRKRGHAVGTNAPSGRILRSVLLKPEHEGVMKELVTRVSAHVLRQLA
ncbi:aminotransferase class I/II-fold pyridoxal phosphate-dependent enzyme [Nocardia sp. NPDC051832]|uniref:pyridoxal phosphate-dependent decarboxylase family protein n=1 Tax=Nocardia sp. NPDC051832 TaxID=3155673 RepID=UPI003439CFF4